MALNIAGQKLEEKLAQASRMLGVNESKAIELALEYYLERHGRRVADESVRAEVNRLFDELAALPVLDNRDPDDILGYDEYGLV